MIKVDTACTGCGLCAQVCPMGCIKMEYDTEGFLIPKVQAESCINCNLCDKKCPRQTNNFKENTPNYYSAINLDKKDLLKSSSGGLFIAFAKEILAVGGVVCGCVYNQNMEAVHTCTDDINVVRKMCGSKYVQSRAFEAFEDIKNYLNSGKKVLFTGTGCQVAALLNLVGENENLITVDILCHGVPSPEFLSKYVEFLENKYHKKVVDLQFRNKERDGWGSEHRTCIYLMKKNGQIVKKRPFLPTYFCAFFWGINLRDSCYECKYAGEKRVSDITIGDYWGFYYKYKKYFDEGISVASVNTNKGEALWRKIEPNLKFVEKLNTEEAKRSNTNFFHPTIRPKLRNGFYNNMDKIGYKSFFKRTFLDKSVAKKLFTSLYGKIMPRKIARFIRSIRG